MATLLLMCDRRDLAPRRRAASECGRDTDIDCQEFATATGAEKEFFEPNLYLYDAYPGGLDSANRSRHL